MHFRWTCLQNLAYPDPMGPERLVPASAAPTHQPPAAVKERYGVLSPLWTEYGSLHFMRG